MNQLLIVDFDRTLFNHREFFQDLSTVMAGYYGINGQQLYDLAHRHDVIRAKATGIFSIFDEVRTNNPSIDIEHLKKTVRDELSGRNYLFADVTRFLERLRLAKIEPVIMTVGTDEYQNFKAEFAPEISVYEFIVTQRTKAEEVAELIADSEIEFEQVTLIDDRGDTFNQQMKSLGVRAVRLKRVDSQYQHIQSPSWAEEITSLAEFVL